MVVLFNLASKLNGRFDLVDVLVEYINNIGMDGNAGVINITFQEQRFHSLKGRYSLLFHVLHLQVATVTDAGDPIAVSCLCW